MPHKQFVVELAKERYFVKEQSSARPTCLLAYYHSDGLEGCSCVGKRMNHTVNPTGVLDLFTTKSEHTVTDLRFSQVLFLPLNKTLTSLSLKQEHHLT